MSLRAKALVADPAVHLGVDAGRHGWWAYEVTVAPAIAGRRRELRAVADVLSGGTDDVALLLAGAAGVGKSRLAAAAAGVAAQRRY